jgi:CRP-like cAMP-binding protein
MSEKIRKLKEEATRLLARGKIAEACGCYEQIVRADPRDLTARQKVAELYGRLGRKGEAVRAYQSVAGSYAADGLLLKAIAVCKIILQLDPSHKETQQILATLTTRRRTGDAPTEPVVVEMPKAMSAALAPGARRSANAIRGVAASNIRSGPAHEAGVEQAAPPASSTSARSASAPVSSSSSSSTEAALAASPVIELTVEVPAPTAGSALGRQPHTSPEELARLAAQLRAAPTAAQQQEIDAEALLLEEVALDIDVDAEDPPLVVGAPVAEDPPPILTAAIAAATPSFDELMAMTAEVGADVTLPPSAPVSDEASFAALREEVGARIDLGEGPLLPGRELAPPPVPTAAIEFDDGMDGADVVDLSEAEVEAARIDVTSVAPIPLFSDLPRDAFVALTERMGLRVASPGEVLLAEDAVGTSMFVIIQGRVRVSRRALDGSGAEVELATLGDGTFFGEGALLSDAPRTATVTCVEETMVFEISRDLLAQMTAEYPSVGEVMRRFHKNRLITNLLKTSVVFAPFSTAEKKDLIERFKSRQVDEGTFLVTREKPGDGLYVVLSGRCEVLDAGPDGRDVVVAELRDGDVFGEMSMLWNKDTCASVRASTSCVVLRLPRHSFSEVIMTYPQILESLAALSERRQKLNTELRNAI